MDFYVAAFLFYYKTAANGEIIKCTDFVATGKNMCQNGNDWRENMFDAMQIIDKT